MPDLYIDIETYSEASLPLTGAQYYARHPSTRVLLFAYAFGEQRPQLVDMASGEPLPDHVREALASPETLKWAHNAAFERSVIEHVLGLPCDPESWRCTMVWALSLSLPAGLDKLSKVLRLGDAAKNEDGKRLIRRFCVPGGQDQMTIDDSEWQRFREYCLQDVQAEQAVAAKLSRYPMPEHEWRAWAVDQRVNDAGLPVDVRLVEHIRHAAEAHRETVEAEAARITQLPNPNSRDQLLQWLDRRGVSVDDLRSATVERLLSGEVPQTVREVLECRQQMSKTSLAKLDALERATCADGRLRGAFQFVGAGRTGRAAGRLFQPQNLPRPTLSDEEVHAARRLVCQTDAETLALLYDDLSGALSSLIRSVIAAPDGRKLVVADYDSIESVMLAWCAESEPLLELYRNGLDPYKDFASKIYGIRYDDVTKQQRSFAKPAVLGCGYGLGAAGLQRYAAALGVELGETEAQQQVATFRGAYSDIPAFWRRVETAVSQAMQSKGSHVRAGRFTFCFDGRFLLLGLPSGRNLYYYQPRLEVGNYGRHELTYAGREPGVRVGTHPGKLAENITQAVARDVLIEGLKNVEAAGYEIVGHVHDEILCLSDADDEGALVQLVDAMTRNPPWCADAPISATGYEAAYYRKD